MGFGFEVSPEARRLVSGGNVQAPEAEFTLSFEAAGVQAENLDVLLTRAANLGVTVTGSWDYTGNQLVARGVKLRGLRVAVQVLVQYLYYAYTFPERPFPPSQAELDEGIVQMRAEMDEEMRRRGLL